MPGTKSHSNDSSTHSNSPGKSGSRRKGRRLRKKKKNWVIQTADCGRLDLTTHPFNTDFKQQRLPIWNPPLTPARIVYALYICACILIPVGFVLLHTSKTVVTVSQRYDNIPDCAYNTSIVYNRTAPHDHVLESQRSHLIPNKMCEVQLKIPEDMRPPIFFYYKLTNFYQNHRQYVKSRDDKQLRGLSRREQQTTDCAPFEMYDDAYGGSEDTVMNRGHHGKRLYPCGLIANSIFLDEYLKMCIVQQSEIDSGKTAEDLEKEAEELGDTDRCNYSGGILLRGNNWQRHGIAWPSDMDAKFVDRHMDEVTETRASPLGHILPPVHDEDLAVWMRVATMSTFTKLYARMAGRTLQKGLTLSVPINVHYDNVRYGGEKHIVLSTASWLGGKSPVLGLAYVVVGAALLAAAGMLHVMTCRIPKRREDEEDTDYLGERWR